jgi:hypothetical protein
VQNDRLTQTFSFPNVLGLAFACSRSKAFPSFIGLGDDSEPMVKVKIKKAKRTKKIHYANQETKYAGI